MRTLARLARAAIGYLGEAGRRPLKRARQDGARLLADARGHVTVIVGFCAIAIFGGVGIAVDTSIAYNVKSQLAAAVDAAALAGARAFASPNRNTDIQNFFDANFQEGYMGSVLQPLQIVPNDESRTITVTARATIPTFFMSVLGTDSTDVAATAEATLSSRDVEVALVLDVTGSMGGSKIADLKVAAKELIDIVVQDLQDPFYSKVAIVPYSVAVNVGSYADQIRGTLTSGTCTSPGCTEFEFDRASSGTDTFIASTCVTERPGPNIATDAPPNLAPLGRHYDDGATALYGCVDAPIVPLSSNKTALKAAVDALSADGYTAGHIGVAWGWYMVSPNFGYLWPAESQPRDYGEIHLGQEVLKVVIVMTDGQFNTFYSNGIIAKNAGPGNGNFKINQNATHGNSFDQGEDLCDNMKAEGVIVYTVGFAISSGSSAANFVNYCASQPDYAYLPSSGTELKQAFKDIAVQVSNLRISM
ncbi:pilus assembly protein TadG-related protein [Pelagibius marinus]|uniref:pilus assembly protein TadG-related protein n=1 Tax=Pelagibius marinus TaxID=2762760 RepID=UPI001872FD34|nr:TadE/TadG family type IV pilus assembly protein [Pelagibius marinus]